MSSICNEVRSIDGNATSALGEEALLLVKYCTWAWGKGGWGGY